MNADPSSRLHAMSTVTDTPRELLVSCRTPDCPGFKQRPIDGIARHISTSYLELGGDLGGQEERSTVQFIAKNPADVEGECEHCGSALIVSEQRRMEYPRLTRQEVMGAIQSADSGLQSAIDQAVKVDRLEQRIAELDARLQNTQPPKRKSAAPVTDITDN